MNILYLSPHFPSHYSLFVEALSRYGVKVFGVSDQLEHSFPEVLKNSLTAHYKVDRLEEIGQIRNACHFFRENFGSFDRVESHLEPWLELEAIIRTEFDVWGFKQDDLRFLKQKSLMKSIFDKAGVPTARGIIVENYDQCLSFIRGNYPVFIKPDIGVGASDTYTIKAESDLQRFFSVKMDYAYFLEEFLSGTIESFDGLTDHEGNVVFFTSHVFSDDIHKVVVQNENVYYYSQREIPADLQQMGMNVVKSAGLREKFFHVEFFRRPDGELRGLEINARPPGGLTTHMFNYSCDVDVYDWWASIVAGKDSKRPFERRYHCAFVGKKFDRPYRNSHDDIFRRYPEEVVHNQPMNSIEFQVMGNHGYLVRSPNIDKVKEVISFILAQA